MHLKSLLDAVNDIEEMPIEVHELSAHLIKFGCQDQIIFFPDEEMEPSILKGVHYRYTTSNGVYSPPNLVTLITFSPSLPVEWQRLVCCKELIHICDTAVERTETADEVKALIDKLLGPLTDGAVGVSDLMALKDQIALYQAVGILFPASAREQAIAAIEAGTHTIQDIVEWVALPEVAVKTVLDPEWPEVCKDLFD